MVALPDSSGETPLSKTHGEVYGGLLRRGREHRLRGRMKAGHLELSYPGSRARRVLKANGKPPASRGAPRRARVEIRSGWDYASVGHLVCLVQTCVKGPLCYVMLYVKPAATCKPGETTREWRSSHAGGGCTAVTIVNDKNFLLTNLAPP